MGASILLIDGGQSLEDLMFKKSLLCRTIALLLLAAPAHAADLIVQQNSVTGSLVKELGPTIPNKNGPIRIIAR
jgi:hypothetical protein